MIYYPLSALMLAGIRDILVISTPQDTPRFEQLLGDGGAVGHQPLVRGAAAPDGLAQAFIIGGSSSAASPSCLVLGDKSSTATISPPMLRDARPTQTSGATVFAYPVNDPERYGVVEFDAERQRASASRRSPQQPKSHYAVTGLYFYDNQVVDIAEVAQAVARAASWRSPTSTASTCSTEQLDVVVMGRGHAWLDTGTHESLLEAAQFIETIERRQGLKIACPEEIAYRMGFISAEQLASARARAAQERLRAISAATARGSSVLMKVIRTDDPRGPDPRAEGFGDERGFFLESFNDQGLSRGDGPRRAISCRTTTRARPSTCCAACTIRSGSPRANSCA